MDEQKKKSHWFRNSLVIFFLLIILLCIGVFFAWSNRTSLVSKFLSKHLHVSVTIDSIDLDQNALFFKSFWIGNPPNSRTNTAFSSKSIEIEGTAKNLLQEVLTIDLIEFKDIFLGLEYYDKSESASNWSVILSGPAKKNTTHKYLIRNLVLRNLQVSVTDATGKTTQYPLLKRIELHNISDETGFPVEEIEKALFQAVLKNIIKQFGLKNLFNSATQQWVPGAIRSLPFVPKKP